MLLDLQDTDIRAKLLPHGDDQMRLQIDYPRTAEYRDRVRAALADLLMPNTRQVQARRRRKAQD